MGTRSLENEERVSALLKDTVLLLCRNGLDFSENIKVQGLLGITLDNNKVVLVQLDELFRERSAIGDHTDNLPSTTTTCSASDTPSPRKRRRRSGSRGSAETSSTTHLSSTNILETINLDDDSVAVIKVEPDAFGGLASCGPPYPTASSSEGGFALFGDSGQPQHSLAFDSTATTAGGPPLPQRLVPNQTIASPPGGVHPSHSGDTTHPHPGASNWPPGGSMNQGRANQQGHSNMMFPGHPFNTPTHGSERKQRNVLTLADKVKLIRSSETMHKTTHDLQRDFNVSATVVWYTLRQKDGLLAMWEKAKASGGDSSDSSGYVTNLMEGRFSYLSSEGQALERKLSEWHRATAAVQEVTSQMLQDKGLECASELGIQNFMASSSWVIGFKRRHNIP